MRWIARLDPRDAKSRVVQFTRTCAVFRRLVVDGETIDLGKADSSGQLSDGTTFDVLDGTAIRFDWGERTRPAHVELVYSGEPLRRETAREHACRQERRAKVLGQHADSAAEPASATEAKRVVDLEFEVRRARIMDAVRSGAPLARERLMFCVFDQKTDPRINPNPLLRPGNGADDGPHNALILRVLQRARHCPVPAADAATARKVRELMPYVADALRSAMQTAFGMPTFDIESHGHRAMFVRTFHRFANGDLGDPQGARTEGVPDSGYFFCFAEFAAVARAQDPHSAPDVAFFAQCFPVFVRATRVYFRAYGKPGGTSYHAYGPRRFRRDWESVRSDLEREFAGSAGWSDAQWDAKYTQALQDCCLGKSNVAPASDELWRLCGRRSDADATGPDGPDDDPVRQARRAKPKAAEKAPEEKQANAGGVALNTPRRRSGAGNVRAGTPPGPARR